MKKTYFIAALAFSLSAFPALAQSSQGKGGSDNGPSSNSVTTNGSGPGESTRTGTDMNSTGGMVRDGSGTVGAGTGSAAPSSSGNVGPGTDNNNTMKPSGR